MLTKVNAKTRRSLLQADAIQEVAGILRALDWFLGDLCVVDYEDEKEVLREIAITGDTLDELVRGDIAASRRASERFAAFTGRVPPDPRRLGSLFFKSRAGLREVHFWFDERGLVPRAGETHFGNLLSFVWEDSHCGKHLTEVCLAVMERLFDNALFDHGFCCVTDQYDGKNMDYSGGGARAVGLDVSKALSGFYWGNYFGAYLCKLIGAETLMDVPCCDSIQAQSGVLVVNKLPPDEWSQQAFLANEKAAMEYIGQRFFFEKGKAYPDALSWSAEP